MIGEDSIYATTGAPFPGDIFKIFDWLCNAEFSAAFHNIRAMQLEKGLALSDIITKVFDVVSKYELPDEARVFLIEQLADIERNLSVGTSDKMQLGGVVGAFKIAMDMTESFSVER